MSGAAGREAVATGLEVDRLTVRFDGVAALDAVSLDVPAGSALAILGPSGSGKSTLLRAIAGLEPSEGDVRWAGESITRTPVHRRGFAMLFQDGQLFPHLDVAGNIAYPLRDADRSTRAARVTELLELVGLAGFERRRVTDLSGGEQQRVALARALAASPRLLLLDEPLSALDRELRERLARDVRGILDAAGIASIVVTHDVAEAEVLADRVGVIAGGRLLQVGSFAELRAHPVDPRVAAALA